MKKTPYRMYYDWWVGKWCALAYTPEAVREYKLVLDVELIGPPSFFYGYVNLVYSDYTKQNVTVNEAHTYHGANIFRPRKKDVIALTLEEYHEKVKSNGK